MRRAKRSRGLGLIGLGVAVTFMLLRVMGEAGATPADAPVTHVVKLPGGEAGIGFDDFQYAPTLKRILVPGGRTGRLFLIDPRSRQVAVVEGFSAKKEFSGGHGDGT